MSTENDNEGWIKMIERKPTDADYPIFVFTPHTTFGNGTIPSVYVWHQALPNEHGFTHWQPAQLPAPPKPEPTQRDEDEQALWAWIKVKDDKHENVYAAAWHAALEYRDAQNLYDCQRWNADALSRIQKRCGFKL